MTKVLHIRDRHDEPCLICGHEIDFNATDNYQRTWEYSPKSTNYLEYFKGRITRKSTPEQLQSLFIIMNPQDDLSPCQSPIPTSIIDKLRAVNKKVMASEAATRERTEKLQARAAQEAALSNAGSIAGKLSALRAATLAGQGSRSMSKDMALGFKPMSDPKSIDLDRAFRGDVFPSSAMRQSIHGGREFVMIEPEAEPESFEQFETIYFRY